jgi:hypothetical protein
MALLFLYVHDVRTSLEAQTSTAFYGDSITFLYMDAVRTSQETPVDDGLLQG